MPNDIVTQAIDRIASGTDLSAEEAASVLREVMEGRAGETQTAAFLIALRTKGETVDEVAGLAKTMRELALRVEVGSANLVDTAGTGGGAPSFNVSTTAALLAAAAGATVAKHGNRSATGRCGSADVLEALGARIDLEPGAIAECIADVGFGFMFAPVHHAAMRYVVPVRRALAGGSERGRGPVRGGRLRVDPGRRPRRQRGARLGRRHRAAGALRRAHARARTDVSVRLDEIVQATRDAVSRRKRERPIAELE